LAGISPGVLARTTILFLGDNGTQNPATQPPFVAGHGKGSLFEGGVNVPLIVAGHSVRAAGRQCDALVNTTDLFATMAELAGVRAERVVPPDVTLDSLSLVPYLTNPELPSRRQFVYAEAFKPNHVLTKTTLRRAARGERYKLIVDSLTGVERFFDLAADPFEHRDLLQGPMTQREWKAHSNLRRWIAAVVSTQ
ncbi:MAG: sulfatase/phosphatase domain-containing protein, partial [Planctomycetota bacterium]